MAESVDASVLVPVLDEAEHLPQIAREMLAQQFDGTLEFLFIDGGSRDSTVAIVEALAREDPRVRLLHNAARFTPFALNLGLGAARGRYVVRMDAHTSYGPDYVARGVARLERGDVAHVSGPQLAEGYDEGSRRVALALTSRLGVGGAPFRTATSEREVDSGFLGVWERERVLALGGWDERWTLNQDGELAARIRAAGGRIVCIPEMAAAYRPRNRLSTLGRQYFRYGRFRAKTCVRHPRSMRVTHAIPPALVVDLAAAAVLRGRWALAPRAGALAYAAAVVYESARLADGPGDAARLPGVFATMHLTWGAGFLLSMGHALAPASRAAMRSPARSMA